MSGSKGNRLSSSPKNGRSTHPITTNKTHSSNVGIVPRHTYMYLYPICYILLKRQTEIYYNLKKKKENI